LDNKKIDKILEVQERLVTRLSGAALMGQIIAIIGLKVGDWVEVDTREMYLLVLMMTALQMAMMSISLIVQSFIGQLLANEVLKNGKTK